MKNIKECAEFYNTLLHKDYIFTLENGIQFTIFFKPNNFYHLVGLHKLTDIKRTFDGKAHDKIFKDILSGKISTTAIEKSVFYNRICNRITYFEQIADMLDKEKSKIIIDFNPSLIPGTDLLNTKYILYRHLHSGYANLTIGEKDKKTYPETFFVENSKRYISGQDLLDIYSIEIIERKKKN